MSLRPIELRCEGQRAPLAVAEAAPRLSFEVEALGGCTGRDAHVAAWEVQVASSPDFTAAPDLWASGRCDGDRVFDLRYRGRELEPGACAHWRARVWGAGGTAGPWSEVESWERAPRDLGEWIAPGPAGARVPDRELYGDDPAPHLRAEFRLAAAPVRARLHLVGLGWGEAWINGERVGDAVLDPAWTPYRKRVLFATHDVGDLLVAGDNCLGVILGRGWYDPLPMRLWGYLNLREHLECGRPKLLCRLECELPGGERVVVDGSSKWRAGEGELRRDNVYLGEVVDVRCAAPGWNRPGFDDREWKPAKRVEGPAGGVFPQTQPPVRVLREVLPVALLRGPRGEGIVDFGENFTGWVRLRLRAERGTRVRMRFGELLDADGGLNLATSVCGKIRPGGDSGGLGAPELACQEDVFILGGRGAECFEPRFAFHAFRYVEITGWPGEGLAEADLASGAILGKRISSDLALAGHFECSSPRLEALHGIARRTFRNNLIGVQSDCPHRERFGYGGDLVACAEAVAFCYDMRAFYVKTVRDYADEQRASGGLPETAPDVGIDHGGIEPRVGPVEWGTALPHLLDLLRRFYGETDATEQHLDEVLRWVAYLETQAPRGVLSSGLSDWEALEERPHEVTGTAFLYESARLGVELAEAAGRRSETSERLARRSREAFEREFVDPATGIVAPGNQISQAHAVGLGLLSGELATRAFEVLLATIDHRDGRLATGFFGTRLVFDALTSWGRSDVALRAIEREDCPSYGYMLERGATTLWEQWPWDDRESSHNHPALGSVVAWMYRALGGIHPEGAQEGRIELRPHVDCGLERVHARYRTVRGWVGLEWARSSELAVSVTLPPNLRARLWLPGREPLDLEPGVTRLSWALAE